MSNILEVRNLSISFFDDGGIEHKAVNDISFDLAKGRTLGIVGESGSGKSVSCLAIIGLLPAPPKCTVEGEAIFNVDNNSVNLLDIDEKQRSEYRGRKIAMVFQDPMTALNPVHKCGWQVAEMLRLHEHVEPEEARRRTLELFEEVRLPDPERIFNSYPHEISGGQKQRVMIAMALICNPDLVIADEPTTALDVTVQKSILSLLRDLQRRRGISVIFITHNLGVVANVADDVVVMYKGNIVEQGNVDKIMHRAEHPYTQGLIACRPPEQGRPKRLPTVDDFMNQQSHNEPVCREPFDNSKRLTEEPLLSVRGLSVDYVVKRSLWGKSLKTKRAVNNVNFDLWRGETLGLVGESGCGKTSLGRTIMQFIKAAEGSVMFDGNDIGQLRRAGMRRLRTRIQIIFQDPYSSLNPRLTIGQAIMEPLVCNRMMADDGERKTAVEQIMESVGLPSGWFSRYPHELSGGQRQRVCIARALVVKPDLVVCDEPVSALDVSVQAQVLNLLNQLREQYNYACIFISHDLSVVHFVSDRIMVMRDGEIVELSDADELYSNPQEEYTQTLLSAIPRF